MTITGWTARVFTALIVTTCVAAAAGCGQSSQSTASSTSTLSKTVSSSSAAKVTTTVSSSKPGTSTTAVAGTVLKMKTVSYVDQQGIGKEAFKLLIPSDWQYEGGVQWVLDNPTMPAVSAFRVWNPKGQEQFQVFPNQAFFWTDNPLTAGLFPVGSKYFGNEVKAPLEPLQALKDVVIARFRGNVQGLKIITEQDISSAVSAGNTGSSGGLQTTNKAGKIRIEYTENGKTCEDEIYCVIQATYIPVQTLSGWKTNIMWGVNNIASFRAEKGKLDANARIFQTISDSLKLNLQWFNTYVQVVEYLIKANIQKINSVGQLGSIIAQTGSEIRQENLDLYNQREAVNDSISNQFSQYVRGVDNYYNPIEGTNVELPTGYNNVWVNGSGDYVLSDNPNYNPNVGSNQNFQRLDKAK